MKKWLYFILAAVMLVTMALAMADTDSGDKDKKDEQEINYCLNDATNEKWTELAAKHRDSDAWQRLFALRVGLCAMVARETLPLDRATRIFERERQRALKNLRLMGLGDGPSKGAL